MQQQEHEDDIMQSDQSGREPFVIFGQAAEPCHPTETPLGHPAAGKQHKAPLGFREFDDMKEHSLLEGRLRRLFAIVAGPRSTLGGRLQGAPVEDRRRGVRGTLRILIIR